MLRTTNAAGRIRDESLMNLGGRDLTLIYWSIISTRMIIRQKIYTETFDMHVKSYNVRKC
jgi:hypothetical protein